MKLKYPFYYVYKLKQEIADRDHYDSTRKNSPLVQAEDAILVELPGIKTQAEEQRAED